MKAKSNKIQILFIVVFFIILLSNFSNSSSPFETPKTCSNIFGNCANDSTNDTATTDCSGIQVPGANSGEVEEIYINGTTFFPDSGISVTCQFMQDSGNIINREYLWYFNTTNWINIQNWTNTTPAQGGSGYNRTTSFKLNSSIGTHIVRCIYSYNSIISNQCANSGSMYDNDDVNFTVTSHLTYSFWNLTNYTTGTNISNSQNFTRLDMINVSAQWNKAIYNAWIQHDGNGSSINYSVSSPSNWTNYTLNFSNGTEFSRTGNITISTIYANDTTFATNNTSPSLFFYLWGFSKVAQVTSNQTTLYNSTPIRAFCKVIDNITSQGINNSNVSFYGNENFLNWSLTNSTGYANLSFVVNATSLPSNYSVKCNTTDQSSLYYNASSQNYNSTDISVYSPYQINVSDFWFAYGGTRVNKTNLLSNLTIYANVSDALAVSIVYANFSYPGGTITTNLSMNRTNSPGYNLWNYTFDSQLNATGNYSVNIIANNSYGTTNVSGFKTFFVNSTYDLNFSTNYSTYNRGENITAQVWDVNGFPVYNLNWTANLTRFNQTTNTTNYTNANYTYTIADDDPEGNYTLFVNASKNNNTGNNSLQFNVSRTLYLVISTTTALSPGNTLNVSVYLYNARGELYTNSVNANITCPNGMKSLSFSSGHASTLECTAPDSYSTSFNITANVTDNYNNTGENYTTLTTTSAPSSGGGGGGGGGGFATETKKCSDKTLYNQCSSQNPLYCSNGTLINKCSICGCNNTDYGCQPDGSCILVKKEDFNLETNITNIEIRQGEDKEFVIGILKNTGNTILNLKTFLTVPEDCCNISIPPTVVLKEKEEKEFSLSIHVPLSTNVSEYLTSIGVGTSTFKKERSLTVAVTKSPYYASLEEIVAELSDIEKEIQDYKKAGVDVSNLETKLEQTKLDLSNANNSISTDQLNALTGYISDISGNVNYVQSSLSSIRTRIFFSQVTWLVIILIISSFLTAYMVPEVLVPLYKVENEIRKLKEEEKILVSSRLETEKQYFLRKIDEKTFSNIMIGKQDKILKTRATIEEKEDQSKKIIENRLKPKGIANTVKEKFDKVFKKKNEK